MRVRLGLIALETPEKVCSYILFNCEEAYTDRHNILLFLMRDTTKDHPVGFEKERRNIFDPEEDQLDEDDEKDASGDKETNEKRPENDKTGADATLLSSPQCARAGCAHSPRFDSRFCSDSCGVAALELDLLHSFQESSDIHPAVLRN